MMLTFPGGTVHQEKDSAVDGNHEEDISVPAGKTWIFQSLFVSLDTDNIVTANRKILVRTFNSSSEILDAGIETGSIIKNEIKSLSLTNQANPSDDQGITDSGDYRGEFSFGGSLIGGDFLRIKIVDGTADDKYEYRLRVREFGL
jgi:hypothetical protein